MKKLRVPTEGTKSRGEAAQVRHARIGIRSAPQILECGDETWRSRKCLSHALFQERAVEIFQTSGEVKNEARGGSSSDLMPRQALGQLLLHTKRKGAETEGQGLIGSQTTRIRDEHRVQRDGEEERLGQKVDLGHNLRDQIHHLSIAQPRPRRIMTNHIHKKDRNLFQRFTSWNGIRRSFRFSPVQCYVYQLTSSRARLLTIDGRQ